MKIEVLEENESGRTPEADLIRQRLVEFNQRESGGTDYRDLQVILRDGSGEVRGGLLGWTVWSWCHFDSLWVDESLRGRGWGKKLLEEGEEAARARDCELCDVDTFSFQARAFYEKAGYSLYGTLDGIGKGKIERYYFRKALSSRAPDLSGDDRRPA